jgi:16S rRNA (cytosine1402-N4)-methyltransferase
MGPAAMQNTSAPHIPVLLTAILEQVAPVRGIWLDGTFGAGGYTRGLLDNGAERVLAVDRDPEVFVRARDWAGDYGDRLVLIRGEFADLDQLARDNGADALDGVVLDIGVSSMQIDQAERGFSFMKDGPLDMRMSQQGMSAADVVNLAEEADLADVLFQFGEERASRRIARNIVKARATAPIVTTGQLVEIIEKSLPRPKPGQVHPATRTFQALRIAVNDELGQLVRGLMASERILAEGGLLVVVTFHSLEDRIVKRFIQARSSGGGGGSRHMPQQAAVEPRFERVTRKAIVADADEMAANPRARSAKLRIARRLLAPAGDIDPAELGTPQFDLKRLK